MMKSTDSGRKDPDIAAATKRAAAKVPAAVDRAGDNTPTKPGTEAENAASGSNETRETEKPAS
jgi:hypothetical protein